jgi:hypothetical protein
MSLCRRGGDNIEGTVRTIHWRERGKLFEPIFLKKRIKIFVQMRHGMPHARIMKPKMYNCN